MASSSSSWTRLALWLAATSALLARPISTEKVESLTFGKPFDTISSEGVRLIGDNWAFGGTTVVNRHFVRLTPDRQSKKGYIWSTQPLARREFSLVLTFRISGQGESLYGDGLGLWITTSPNYVEGDNHGFIGSFTGMGFVFDTFVNHDHAGGHKDVTFFENNGTRTLDDLNYMNKLGCAAPSIRYHEGNAAFSPSLNMSRAKIQYRDNYVQISLDAKNTGDWVKCYGQPMSFTDEWLDNAYIGLTASTGALADNHDVVALTLYDDVIDSNLATLDATVKNATSLDLDESLNEGDAMDKLRILKRKYVNLIEDFEHQFTALKESTENTIRKLREQEEEDTKIIAELEAWANGKVTEKVSTSVEAIRGQVDQTLKATVEETAKKSSGWKMPFFFLMLGVGAFVAAAFKKYQDLRKSHLL